VTATALEQTLFPLGELTKPEVRRLAAQFKLPTATKPDSQGICFVGEVGMKEFLRQFLPTRPGPVVLARTGETLGQHEGAVFYTLGQRHGLGIGGGQPYYVTGKDMATNTVYVTNNPVDLQLARDEFALEQTHWIGSVPEAGHSYEVRCRHRGELIKGRLKHSGQHWRVQLAHAERAISPGQSAVVYDGDTVLGGGIIAG
jgi:tRNA-specific 2-thiouridylase